MTKRRNTFAISAAGSLLVALLAGCSGGDDEAASTTTSAAPEPAATSSAPSAAGTTGPATGTASGAADAQTRNDGALAAVATAAQAAGGTAYEIDDSDDDQNWEVDVWVDGRKVEVKVSGDGSQVIEQGQPEDDDDDAARIDSAQTTLAEAIQAGLAEVPGSVLDDVELDDEDGTTAYEVSVDLPDDDDTEVIVNAQNGSVIRVDR